jgi:hypothetical protein
MLTVICVKWGIKYGPEYVHRLRAGVARHIDEPYQFVCFTDRPVNGIYCRELPSDLPTWWSKIGLFRSGLVSGQKLYLDLDMIVTGPLNVFLRPESKTLWALDDFSYSLRTPKEFMDEETRRLLGGYGTCNSSVMYWNDDVARDAWENFSPEAMQRLHGDQNFLTQQLYPQKMSLYPPGLAASYKYHVLRGHRFGSVTIFHGNPKPDELERDEPLRQVWLAA